MFFKPTVASIIAIAISLTASCGWATADDKAKSETKSDPYPLDTCIISGGKLGSMGKPVVKDYDGQEVRFCCKSCVKPFEEKKAEMLKKIDEQIVAQQLPHYPLKNCVVMPDDTLDAEGGKPVNYVYHNRLVRFCCKDCVGDFKKNPSAYLKKIDVAVIEQQKPNYPLDTDVVTGAKLDDKAIDRVYGVTLVRFANEDSIAKYNSEPLTYNAKLHEAWMAKHPDHKTAPADKGEKKDDKKDPHAGHDHG